LRQEYDVGIRWIAFPLHPETPEEGRSLEALFAGREINVDQLLAKLKQAASDAGLPFGDRKMTFNSRLAQELGKWAESKGRGSDYHHAVFRAYFVDGTNIGKPPELIRIVASVGLSAEDAEETLRSRSFSEAVDRDWARSRAMGIRAVPTFVLNGQRLVGAQSYESLARFVKISGIGRRIVK
jgi:predicted DsbA family dithiol-disulfide isomerase